VAAGIPTSVYTCNVDPEVKKNGEGKQSYLARADARFTTTCLHLRSTTTYESKQQNIVLYCVANVTLHE